MVSILTILALCFSLLACLVFPIVLCIVFMKKNRPGALPLIAGIVVFILFALVLEQTMHYFILVAIPATATLMANNVWVYAVYGALAAGIFEEGGRFLAFRFALKKTREWKHGVLYGIGHGGIEAILIAAPSAINYLVYALMINTGSFDAIIKSSPKATADLLISAKTALLAESSWIFALSGVERICAISIQIALSILICYAVYKKKYILVGLAVLLHAIVDFPAVLAQKGLIPSLAIEGYVVVCAVVALIFILRSRKLFPAQVEAPQAVEAEVISDSNS